MSENRFGIWLLEQRHRNDPVGDLARDYAYGEGPMGTSNQVRAHLKAAGASRVALAAFNMAVTEWEAL